MCSVLLRHEPRHNRWYNLVAGWLEGLGRGYRRALGLALRHRAVVVVVGLLVAGASGVRFSVVKRELAPVEERGLLYDREGVVEGKSGVVGVDLGVRGII